MSGDERDGSDLVILARCADTIEAASLRMFLDSRGLYSLVQGEHHGTGGGFGELPEVAVMVREADLEEAARLLELFQQGTPAVEDEGEEPAPAGKAAQSGKREPPDEGRRYSKRIGVAIIVSLSLTFGCGHFYAGARKRGLALLLFELIAGAAMFSGQAWGGTLLWTGILTDMIGSSVLISRRRAEARGEVVRPGSKWPGRVAFAALGCAVLGIAASTVAQKLAERRRKELSSELAQVHLTCDAEALWLENASPVAQRIGLSKVTTSSTPILALAFYFDPEPRQAEEWPIGLPSPGPWTLPPGARHRVPYAPPKSGPCAGTGLLGSGCPTLVAEIQRLDERSGAVEAITTASCRVE